MKLKELLHGLDVLELHADEALDITGVQYDSRQVTPGDLFVAISGFQTDGHKYIPKAMENGASCVVCEKFGKCPAVSGTSFSSDKKRSLLMFA